MRNTTVNVRTTDKTKQLLQQVAEMLGTTVSGFLLSCATEKAHKLMRDQHHFLLNDEQWANFCEQLDRKPATNKKLIGLMASKAVFRDE